VKKKKKKSEKQSIGDDQPENETKEKEPSPDSENSSLDGSEPEVNGKFSCTQECPKMLPNYLSSLNL